MSKTEAEPYTTYTKDDPNEFTFAVPDSHPLTTREEYMDTNEKKDEEIRFIREMDIGIQRIAKFVVGRIKEFTRYFSLENREVYSPNNIKNPMPKWEVSRSSRIPFYNKRKEIYDKIFVYHEQRINAFYNPYNPDDYKTLVEIYNDINRLATELKNSDPDYQTYTYRGQKRPISGFTSTSPPSLGVDGLTNIFKKVKIEKTSTPKQSLDVDDLTRSFKTVKIEKCIKNKISNLENIVVSDKNFGFIEQLKRNIPGEFTKFTIFKDPGQYNISYQSSSLGELFDILNKNYTIFKYCLIVIEHLRENKEILNYKKLINLLDLAVGLYNEEIDKYNENNEYDKCDVVTAKKLLAEIISLNEQLKLAFEAVVATEEAAAVRIAKEEAAQREAAQRKAVQRRAAEATKEAQRRAAEAAQRKAAKAAEAAKAAKAAEAAEAAKEAQRREAEAAEEAQRRAEKEAAEIASRAAEAAEETPAEKKARLKREAQATSRARTAEREAAQNAANKLDAQQKADAAKEANKLAAQQKADAAKEAKRREAEEIAASLAAAKETDIKRLLLDNLRERNENMKKLIKEKYENIKTKSVLPPLIKGIPMTFNPCINTADVNPKDKILSLYNFAKYIYNINMEEISKEFPDINLTNEYTFTIFPDNLKKWVERSKSMKFILNTLKNHSYIYINSYNKQNLTENLLTDTESFYIDITFAQEILSSSIIIDDDKKNMIKEYIKNKTLIYEKGKQIYDILFKDLIENTYDNYTVLTILQEEQENLNINAQNTIVSTLNFFHELNESSSDRELCESLAKRIRIDVTSSMKKNKMYKDYEIALNEFKEIYAGFQEFIFRNLALLYNIIRFSCDDEGSGSASPMVTGGKKKSRKSNSIFVAKVRKNKTPTALK